MHLVYVMRESVLRADFATCNASDMHATAVTRVPLSTHVISVMCVVSDTRVVPGMCAVSDMCDFRHVCCFQHVCYLTRVPPLAHV